MSQSQEEVKVKVEVEEKKNVIDLETAKTIYNGLQDDIQSHLIQEFIMPQLKEDDLVNNLIKEFDKLLNSNECQRLEWPVLKDVVGKIIENKAALLKMFEINTAGFQNSYEQHFIQKRNTFVRFDCPLSSMCAELTMRTWH